MGVQRIDTRGNLSTESGHVGAHHCQLPISRILDDKENAVYAYDGILFGLKKRRKSHHL